MTTEKVIVPKCCPVCRVQTNFIHRLMNEGDEEPIDWYRCQCGVVFRESYPEVDIYDRKYIDNYDDEKLREQFQHASYVYIPLIEELTYGRMILDVGYGGVSYNLDFLKKRGWLAWGIDSNSSIQPGGNIYKGDFETYDFSFKDKLKDIEEVVGTDKIRDRTFDIIWMAHVFEHFRDPIAMLRKCYNLLREDGVIYISTPDIDFINKVGVSEFPHWKKDEHYIMWTTRALKREVERAGYEVIMCRRNFHSRFMQWFDLHLICQKIYY